LVGDGRDDEKERCGEKEKEMALIQVFISGLLYEG
jgi:hypothetical protein